MHAAKRRADLLEAAAPASLPLGTFSASVDQGPPEGPQGAV